MLNLKDLTAEITQVARNAGEFIRNEALTFDIRQTEVKGLNNFVSYVDKGSEQIIVNRLGKLLPEAGFMTEEGTSEKEGKQYTWIVDPLDGTTNFLHGLPPYAVSIGLRDNGMDVAGAVYEIKLNEMFSAWKEGGAWLNGKRIHVTGTDRLADSLIATGFPYTDFSRFDGYMKLFSWFCQHSHGVRRLGSAATDIAYIASGRFEAFYEYGLYPWDISAAAVILREAGGIISDFSGNESNLTGKEVIASNSNVFPEILKIVTNFMKQ